jgi:hypothetical protein
VDDPRFDYDPTIIGKSKWVAMPARFSRLKLAITNLYDSPVPSHPMIKTDDSVPPAPEPRASRVAFQLRGHVRQKLPEILIDAGSIVLAILLAFAVDEWRERRSQQALAERARRTIVLELKANQSELRLTRTANAQRLERHPGAARSAWRGRDR